MVRQRSSATLPALTLSPLFSDRLTFSTLIAEWRDLLILVVIQRRFKFAQERAQAAADAAAHVDGGDLRQW